VDLNSDMGEAFGVYRLADDEALLDFVTSANVACGFHAGDPETMIRTVEGAVRRGVRVGAHPSYRDLVGFGRRALDATPAEITADIIYQIGALDGVARACSTRVSYVKPHGALYNTMTVHQPTAQAVVAAVRAYDPSMPVLTLPGSAVIDAAAAAGVTALCECFADRAYTPEGRLVPRRQDGAVLVDEDAVVSRAVEMATAGTVEAIDGSRIEVHAASMCLHSDTPGAVALARRIRHALDMADVEVTPFT
jgi:UPF0271 protein